jgi:hypothetical protein
MADTWTTVSDQPPTSSVTTVNPIADEVPDLDKHSPNTYAALMASQAARTTEGMRPVQEQIWKVYDDALQKAQDYHKSILQKQQEANINLQAEAAKVRTGSVPNPNYNPNAPTSETNQPRLTTPSLLQTEESQRAQAASAVKLQEAQPGGLLATQKQRDVEAAIAKEAKEATPLSALLKAQGATDEQIAALGPNANLTLPQITLQQQKAAEATALQRPSEDDQKLVNGYLNGYQMVDQLQKYHAAMFGGTGGGVGKAIFDPVLRKTSRSYIDFKTFQDSSITPIGRGVFGDVGASATKANIMENLKDSLINENDNIPQAGDKTWMLKNRIVQQLGNARDQAIAAHKDPAIWDSAIANIGANWNSNETQQYHPSWYDPNRDTPIVQVGNSYQASQVVNSLNAAINKNLGTTGTQPTGYVSGTGSVMGGPAPYTPRPLPGNTPSGYQPAVGMFGQ